MLNNEMNPLLDNEKLASIQDWIIKPMKMVQLLVNSPVPMAGQATVELSMRRLQVEKYHEIFVPTSNVIRVADQILRTLFHGLERRNPRLPEVQRWINATQQWHGHSIDAVPWNPIYAQGMILEGMTGIGKSHIVDRVMSLLPQTVDHQPNGDWGVQRLRQLVWLKVPMPADHSRKGLLISILAEMDRVLETTYYSHLVKTTNRVETLLVSVMRLLVQHRCGMLVIEEAQEANLGSQAFYRDFLNFFLRILNWGIPILIVGNPLSFYELQSHAQDEDRFTEGGWFSLLPEWGPESKTWINSWLPGVWDPCLLDLPDAAFTPVASVPQANDWPSFLWQLTGGLPRQLSRLRSEVMDFALLNGTSQITSEFVMMVFQSSDKFKAVAARNKALANHDFKALMRYKDIPIRQLSDYWFPDQSFDAVRQKQKEVPHGESQVFQSKGLTSAEATADSKQLSEQYKSVAMESRRVKNSKNLIS